MTYSELNTLFETIATAMTLSYENGPKDQLNTVLRNQATKYPICYSLPFIQIGEGSSVNGPEFLIYDEYMVQIAFLDIDGTSRRTPDTNNAEKRSILDAMFIQAKIFLYNLYEGSLDELQNTQVMEYSIDPLTAFYDQNGATGALLEFKIRTPATFDCAQIVV
jgi:hypothetical protein